MQRLNRSNNRVLPPFRVYENLIYSLSTLILGGLFIWTGYNLSPSKNMTRLYLKSDYDYVYRGQKSSSQSENSLKQYYQNLYFKGPSRFRCRLENCKSDNPCPKNWHVADDGIYCHYNCGEGMDNSEELEGECVSRPR